MFILSWCFFFKQKTAYELRISDWSSDVCSSDLEDDRHRPCDVEHALCAVKHRRNGHAHRQRDEQKGQVRPRSDMSSDEQCKTGKGRGEKADSAAREARFGRAMQSKEIGRAHV